MKHVYIAGTWTGILLEFVSSLQKFIQHRFFEEFFAGASENEEQF